ncbi:MAG: hypothetical protein Q9168_007933 [Polycauliona sp. 1 TL-2023]
MKRARDNDISYPRKRQKLNPTGAELSQLTNFMTSMTLKPTTFPFLQLPPEIRNQIYELCLTVRGPINPFLISHLGRNRIVRRGQPKPSVALFRVSKQLRSEAEPVLYAKNTWIYNESLTQIRPSSLKITYHPFWQNLEKLRLQDMPLGPVIMPFSYRDLNQDLLGFYYTKMTRTRQNDPTAANPQANGLGNMHDNTRAMLYLIWHRKLKALWTLAGRSHPPKKLVLDFTECYCHGGCCRPVEVVLMVLALHQRYWAIWHGAGRQRAKLWNYLMNVKIEVTGLLDEKERTSVAATGFPASFFLQGETK